MGKAVLENSRLGEFCTKSLVDSRRALQTGIESLLAKKTQLETVWPSQTNFIFVKTPTAAEISRALQKEGIAVRQMDGFLRFTAGNTAENKALLKALEKVVR